MLRAKWLRLRSVVTKGRYARGQRARKRGCEKKPGSSRLFLIAAPTARPLYFGIAKTVGDTNSFADFCGASRALSFGLSDKANFLESCDLRGGHRLCDAFVTNRFVAANVQLWLRLFGGA